MFLLAVRTYIRTLETHGYALNFAFATTFSKDAITLALSDAVMVASTAICVPFAKALSKGWIRYYWTGLILQHSVQSLMLFAAVTWTFNRCVSLNNTLSVALVNLAMCSRWPWVQSGFLTLHSLVCIQFFSSTRTELVQPRL